MEGNRQIWRDHRRGRGGERESGGKSSIEVSKYLSVYVKPEPEPEPEPEAKSEPGYEIESESAIPDEAGERL